MTTPDRAARDAAIALAYTDDKLTLKQCADRFGLCVAHVARILQRLGVPRRGAVSLKPRPAAGKRQKQDRHDAAIAAHYQAGDSMEKVAAKIGCHPSWVAKRLEHMGIPRRPCSRSRTEPARKQAICEAYRGGLSMEKVGEQFGVSGARVREILLEMGEPRRPAAHLVKPATLRPSQPKPEPGPRFSDLAPIVPAGVKVTVCPSGKDHRFTVARPEPFFARGVSLPPSPWVAAVTQARQYGGQR